MRALAAIAASAMLMSIGPGPAHTGTGIAYQYASAATGSIAGHVTLTTRVPGAALPANTYATRRVTRHAPAPIPEIRNVVVYLRHPGFKGELPVVRRELRQQDEAFVPHVLAITRGSTVDFPNADPIFHNVFSLSAAGTFDLGRYPQGQSRAFTFNKPGLVKVYCHIHSHMTATILVLDHPYFAVPGNDGTFRLDGVPPGRYTLVGWHERVGEREAQVDVAAGGTVNVEMSLPVEDGQ